MDFEEAKKLVEENVKTKNLRKHMYATAEVLAALARRLGEDVDLWRLTGLLHDLDYDATKDKPEEHARKTVEMLSPYGLPEEMLHAILAHAEKAPLESKLDIALYAADPVTGFIVACALIRPEKKLSAIDVDFMLKRWKEKRFAAGASREAMDTISRLGIERREFLDISLSAMQAIAGELGL